MAPPSDITLAIEVSNPGSGAERDDSAPGPSVALGRAAAGRPVELIGIELIRSDGRHNDDLLPAIDRLTRRAGLTPRDLGCVAVSSGPGGFTGLRIAVAATKMICEATGAGCISVPTANALIRRVSGSLRQTRDVLIALAWKREDAWIERFAGGAGDVPVSGGAALLHLDRIAIRPVDALVCDPEFERILADRGLIPAGLVIEHPRFDASAVLEASVSIPRIDPPALLPLYPREPEAVTKWRALHRHG